MQTRSTNIPAEAATLHPMTTIGVETSNSAVNGLNQDREVYSLDHIQEDWVQQMHALEPLQWAGGEHHFEGCRHSLYSTTCTDRVQGLTTTSAIFVGVFCSFLDAKHVKTVTMQTA
jgi:hypothetical protein